MLGIPIELKQETVAKTRAILDAMVLDGFQACIAARWEDEYAATCLVGLARLVSKYGATVMITQGQVEIKVLYRKDIYHCAKQPTLADALVAMYDAIRDAQPESTRGHREKH